MTGALASCRVCAASLGAPDFDDPGPSLASIRAVLEVPTRVWLCATCGHAQGPDLPDLADFYDRQYRISLDVDGHDQLYQNAAGEAVFRTEKQAEIVLTLDIPWGAAVLDFGAGKATTLQRVLALRPDLHPHVFDVSTDYAAHWATWVPNDAQATYDLPEAWTGRFDLITAHFVLEHVPDPVAVLAEMRRCLAPEGRIFLTVPDAGGNTGDLLVVDHLNHFSRSSLDRALDRAGLAAAMVDREAFGGAFAVTAKAGNLTAPAPVDLAPMRAALDQWRGILDRLGARRLRAPVAIYGAGFYGSIVAARLATPPACFLDRNPYLQGQSHLDLPVLPPEECPAGLATLVAALNPRIARDVLEGQMPWLPQGVEVIWLDEGPGP